jgi:Family of unknown function (DUF6502)
MRQRSGSTHHARTGPSRAAATTAGMQVRGRNVRALPFALIAQDHLLSGAVQFLASVDLPPTAIARRLRTVADMVEVGGSVQTVHSAEYDLYARICSVVHDWIRSPEYTDNDGEPRALLLRGRRSLSVLIRKRLPRPPLSQILQWMTARGVVRRRKDGRYILLRRAVLVGKRDPVYIEWAATVATEHLKTTIENWNATDREARQLDRIARVFNLPEDEVSRFRAFAKTRAQSWLEEIDNWLEDHDAPRGRRRRVEAGVHVYAYVRDARRDSGSQA